MQAFLPNEITVSKKTGKNSKIYMKPIYVEKIYIVRAISSAAAPDWPVAE